MLLKNDCYFVSEEVGLRHPDSAKVTVFILA